MKKLSFPLYHGTSTLFEEQIIKNGLGGGNPIKEYKIIELLKQLKTIADNHQIETGNISDIITQNYGSLQHGQVYLTPSPRIANHYAFKINGNKYGSECFTELFDLVDNLNKKKISIPSSINNEYYEVFLLKEKTLNRRVYQLNNLTLSDLLCSENGDLDIDSRVIEIENLIANYGNGKSKFYDKIGNKYNFRLRSAIPWINLIEI